MTYDPFPPEPFPDDDLQAAVEAEAVNTRTPEPKVVAATTGAGAGVIIANAILWFFDTAVITPHVEGDLPGPVVLAVNLVIPAAVAFLAGYVTRHQYRALPPDPENP